MRRKQRRGFVLLMTLLLITIAACAMVGASIRTLNASVAAEAATDELQRRWTGLTLEPVLAAHAETLLSGNGASQIQSWVTWRTTLGGQAVTAIILDEQAKLNVNVHTIETLTRQPDRSTPVPQEIESALERLAHSADTGPQGSLGHKNGILNIESLLGPVALQKALATLDPPPAALREMTCWGNGQVNIHRASRDVLAAVCGDLLSVHQLDALETIQQRDPKISLNKLFDALGVAQIARSRLSQVLTDESHCHGVWIITQARMRSWYQLVVEEKQGDGIQQHRFVW